MNRYAVVVIVFLAFGVITLAEAAVGISNQRPNPTASSKPVRATTPLMDALNRSGRVQVIVMLDTDDLGSPSVPPHMLARGAPSPFAARQAAVSSQLMAQGLSVKRSFRTLPALVTRVNEQELRALMATPGVADVVLDEAVPPLLDGTISIIRADVLHTGGIDGEGFAVAILDTGVDRDHPMFADALGNSRVVAEACFSTNWPSSGEESLCPSGNETQFGVGAGVHCVGIGGCDHGTHVAGIAAGSPVTVSGTSLVGVAPASDIVGIQVFTKFTDSTTCGGSPPCVLSYNSDQLAALEWLLTQDQSQGGTLNVAAANMSLGGGRYYESCTSHIASAIDSLWAQGIATVIASGNNGYSDSVSSPACNAKAISVGATTNNDLVAWYSNASADLIDLYAPGSSVFAAGVNGSYVTKSGTSMATPHVAGAWALMRQAGAGDGTGAGLEATLSLLQQTGVLIEDRESSGSLGYSHPRIDLSNALDRLNSENPWLYVNIAGEGSVTSTPVGIDCSPDCTMEIQVGDSIELTATESDSNYSFSEWTGCDQVSNATCTVSVTELADRSVTASFVLIPPNNDNFADALTFIGNPLIATRNTLGATLENGEPVPTCDPTAGKSIWYYWTAPTADNRYFVDIDTVGSNYDTILDVFSGNSMSELTSLGCDYGTSEADWTDSAVSFEALAGETYYMRISGWENTGGEAVLNWSWQTGTDVGVSVTGSEYGRVSVAGYCDTASAPCAFQVKAGTTVTFESTPTPSGQFVSWGGDCLGVAMTESCDITVGTTAVNVEATFEPGPTIFHDRFEEPPP